MRYSDLKRDDLPKELKVIRELMDDLMFESKWKASFVEMWKKIQMPIFPT